MRLVIFDPAGNPHFSLRHQLFECPLTARRGGAYCVGPLELFDYTGAAAGELTGVVVTFAYAYAAARELVGGAEALVVLDKQRALDPFDLMELGAGGLRVLVVETSAALVPALCAALGLAPREFLDP